MISSIVALVASLVALAALAFTALFTRFLVRQLDRAYAGTDRLVAKHAELIETLPKLVGPWLGASQVEASVQRQPTPEERAASVESVLEDSAAANLRDFLKAEGASDQQADAAVADALAQLKGL